MNMLNVFIIFMSTNLSRFQEIEKENVMFI